MPNRNSHEVMGHLGKDPELRMTPTGKQVCRLNIATSNSFLDKNSQKWVDKEPDWHSVVIWDALAEKVAREFAKGDAIMVRGKSKTREYEKGGQKKRITEIIASEVYAPIYPKKSNLADVQIEEAAEAPVEETELPDADIPF